MSSRDTAAVRLEGVTRAFGRKAVLRGVTGSIGRGRVVGLLGRNGEGKTTLFQILLDLLAADSGEIEVLGLRPDGSGRIRQRVGYVPERPVFHESMSVQGVLDFRSRFFEGWRMARAWSLAKQLELDLFAPVRGASKGTLGKLAWVCASAHEPELLFLDEPTSGLDSLVREGLLTQVVQELQASGRTILVANHRMDELAGILDEVWVLSGGVVARRHEVDRLREEACRITARVKPGSPGGAPWPVPPLRAEGALVEWAVFERRVAEQILASGRVENSDRRPMSVEESLKLLLTANGGNPHA